jgi:urocanate hydratase
MEKESIAIQHALHKFLAKHIDGTEDSIKKLEKLLTYDNFKGLIRQNEDFLD